MDAKQFVAILLVPFVALLFVYRIQSWRRQRAGEPLRVGWAGWLVLASIIPLCLACLTFALVDIRERGLNSENGVVFLGSLLIGLIFVAIYLAVLWANRRVLRQLVSALARGERIQFSSSDTTKCHACGETVTMTAVGPPGCTAYECEKCGATMQWQ